MPLLYPNTGESCTGCGRGTAETGIGGWIAVSPVVALVMQPRHARGSRACRSTMREGKTGFASGGSGMCQDDESYLLAPFVASWPLSGRYRGIL